MDFSYKHLKETILLAKSFGYKIFGCNEYYNLKINNNIPEKFIVFRIDIDWSCRKTKTISDILNECGVNATFFIRLHGEEYNPFAFENYLILKEILSRGNELGYHSEVIDMKNIWNEDAKNCLIRDIKILELIFNTKIKGVASHGGYTQFNNLDFWNLNKPEDFGLLYEAYDKNMFNLFYESTYISDSNYKWKIYRNGIKVNELNKTLSDLIIEKEPFIYLNMHPECYYNRHIYENYP